MSATRVLVIDDNEDARTLIQLALRAEGFDVSTASNGTGVSQRVQEFGAAIVITDIVMPERDGIETIAELRRDFPAVKIIAISGAVAMTGFDYLAVPRELGAERVLRKPFNLDELISAVRELA